MPFSGELDIEVTATRTVSAAELDRVRGVTCSFEPEASASISLTLVGRVVPVRSPCAGPDLDSTDVVDLDEYLVGLGVESAEVGRFSSPQVRVVLPAGTKPVRERAVTAAIAEHLTTVPGVFVDLQGEPTLTGSDTPVDLTVRVGDGLVAEPEAPTTS